MHSVRNAKGSVLYYLWIFSKVMTKYLINRILRALLSVVLVIAVIMVMVYAFMDREAIFASDPTYPKMLLNKKETYMMQQWERFGYVDYIPFTDFLKEEVKAGNMTQEEANEAALIGAKAADDSANSTHTIALS